MAENILEDQDSDNSWTTSKSRKQTKQNNNSNNNNKNNQQNNQNRGQAQSSNNVRRQNGNNNNQQKSSSASYSNSKNNTNSQQAHHNNNNNNQNNQRSNANNQTRNSNVSSANNIDQAKSGQATPRNNQTPKPSTNNNFVAPVPKQAWSSTVPGSNLPNGNNHSLANKVTTAEKVLGTGSLVQEQVTNGHNNEVDDTVTPKELENAKKVKSSDINLPVEGSALNQQIELFPPKPKQRFNLGKEIKVETNHFMIPFLKKNDSENIRQYDVTIKDQKTSRLVESTNLGIALYRQLIAKYPQYKDKIIYDYKKSLFTNLEFPQDPFTFLFHGEKKDKMFVVEIRKTIEKEDMDHDLNRITILQILFTNNLKLDNLRVGRSFFNGKCEKKQLGFNVDMWQGFFVSIRPSECGYNINFDTAYAAFTGENTNMINLACQYFEYYGRKNERVSPQQLVSKFNDRKNKEDFLKSIKGQKVKDGNGFTKKVQGLSDTANKHKFDCEGKQISVCEYFKQKKNINLKYPNLPCLDLGNGNIQPMEVCNTVTTNKTALSTKEQGIMVRKTAVPAILMPTAREPETRRQNIIDLFDQSKVGCDPILANFGIDIVPACMTQVNAHIIAPPQIEYGQKNVISIKEGKWDNVNKKFYETPQLSSNNFKWAIINSGVELSDKDVDNIIYALIDVSNLHNLKLGDPCYVDNMDIMQNKPAFEELFSNSTYDLIVFILSGANSSEAYKLIKTYGDVKYGIATQIINEQKIFPSLKENRKLEQYISNICLKINCKLNGINFRLSPMDMAMKKVMPQFLNGNNEYMIFGVDVIHPSPGDKGDSSKSESIAAITASLDANYCKYTARLLAQRQPKGESLEQIHDLRLPVEELLRLFFEKNKIHPNHLLFFRDGVSEGQFKNVKNHEMNEIRKACFQIDPSGNYKPGVTFVVASKRNHTRFFPLNSKDAVGKAGNVPPGTLVDTKVVTPNMFDFFLVSHFGIQGTSKPCHYFVLHDENNFTMNSLGLLTHYLCHIYERTTGAVSYPTPTYYADLCAERGRQYIRNDYIGENIRQVTSVPIRVHEKFKDRMFFI